MLRLILKVVTRRWSCKICRSAKVVEATEQTCYGLQSAPCEAERFEDLPQGQKLAIPEDDNLIWLLPQLALDEPQQMLLMHAGTVVHMSVHL